MFTYSSAPVRPYNKHNEHHFAFPVADETVTIWHVIALLGLYVAAILAIEIKFILRCAHQLPCLHRVTQAQHGAQ